MGVNLSPSEIQTLIDDIVERLARLAISRIIVFGSSVNGGLGPDSDIDLAIVVSEPKRFSSYDSRLEAKAQIRKQIHDINEAQPIAILLYTEAEFSCLLREGGFVAEEIVSRGRTVHKKAS